MRVSSVLVAALASQALARNDYFTAAAIGKYAALMAVAVAPAAAHPLSAFLPTREPHHTGGQNNAAGANRGGNRAGAAAAGGRNRNGARDVEAFDHAGEEEEDSQLESREPHHTGGQNNAAGANRGANRGGNRAGAAAAGGRNRNGARDVEAFDHDDEESHLDTREPHHTGGQNNAAGANRGGNRAGAAAAGANRGGRNRNGARDVEAFDHDEESHLDTREPHHTGGQNNAAGANRGGNRAGAAAAANRGGGNRNGARDVEAFDHDDEESHLDAREPHHTGGQNNAAGANKGANRAGATAAGGRNRNGAANKRDVEVPDHDDKVQAVDATQETEDSVLETREPHHTGGQNKAAGGANRAGAAAAGGRNRNGAARNGAANNKRDVEAFDHADEEEEDSQLETREPHHTGGQNNAAGANRGASRGGNRAGAAAAAAGGRNRNGARDVEAFDHDDEETEIAESTLDTREPHHTGGQNNAAGANRGGNRAGAAAAAAGGRNRAGANRNGN
ncbi:hypothetical protein Micbo1qcDRAFT_206935 [Microdochium bolleyi]|uniref:Uncharacterized protein n=1 Tax=Microdochium bolleyi TaxID=196109 RepID=A0A136IV77_9PEZI|nr:hypothetical protein Micbo1qcDRAFT_206935 [Microdochium bolleyi]